MITATLCDKFKLPIAVDLKGEDDLDLHSRSYIHYAATHQDLVSAKCWATKWLLEGCDLDRNSSYTAIEYFAGIGVMTCLIRELLPISDHFVIERDERCYEQLCLAFPSLTVGKADFKHIAKSCPSYDLKFLDFPSSSIAQMHSKWKIDNFLFAFESQPEMVVWTDTSICYPMTLHGKSYKKYFGCDNEIKTLQDYIWEYSFWLFRKTGYSITRVAQRANNALYIMAQQTRISEYDFKSFPLKTSTGGFVING